MSFVTGWVEQVLAGLPGRPDVVVLDPSRRGLAGRWSPRWLTEGLLASCTWPAIQQRSPVTSLLTSCGYRLLATPALDAFPMTHHVRMHGRAGSLTGA